MKTKDIVLMGMLGALLFIFQVAFAFLPNIEFVSLFIIIFTLKFGKKAILSIYVFALLEGLLYGFGIWWIMYLYIWTILAWAALIFQKKTSVLFWATLSAVFGLSFGALSSFPYFIIGGVGAGIGYWINGIPFDIVHCIANFVVVLVLFQPMRIFFDRIKKI
ncbi:energy-coupling factor transport system substrate-specific component [Mobilisporobacter senegalensis]|uniref:Energy-coupling factor transport system substrate-specific component n=1 Tax=Mobilisporobacter senegalensis TaxID=1329262 RepID=A0A3N1Y2Y9_9FIRM|nr:hypothetical protein [Mobilisporobacter senegalensis]ROR31922.1 energy-coupling factor transport system substrate-specific component [Mobilisporobacter senegalensis]